MTAKKRPRGATSAAQSRATSRSKAMELVGGAGELHQQAGGTHPPLTTKQGIPVVDNQNSLRAYAARPDAARRLRPAREDHALRP